jgi:hypothetical protein
MEEKEGTEKNRFRPGRKKEEKHRVACEVQADNNKREVRFLVRGLYRKGRGAELYESASGQ